MQGISLSELSLKKKKKVNRRQTCISMHNCVVDFIMILLSLHIYLLAKKTNCRWPEGGSLTFIDHQNPVEVNRT